MSDLPDLIKGLLDIATDSLQQKDDAKLLSLLIARKLFDRNVISLVELGDLVEVHFRRTLTQKRLLELVKTPALAKICSARSDDLHNGVVYLEPSPTTFKLIHANYLTSTIQASNTNVRVASTTNSEVNNNEPSESERLVQMINGEFTCVVCLDTLNETVESSCCQTLCCRVCAEKLPTCPTCRALNIKWQANHPIRRIIGKRPVKCSHNGCSSWPTTAELKTHLSNCDYRLVTCPYNGCAARMKQIDVQKHKLTCKHSMETCHSCRQSLNPNKHLISVQCPNLCGAVDLCEVTLPGHIARLCPKRRVGCTSNECQTMVPADTFYQHLQICDFVTAPCINNGCQAVVLRKDLPAHLLTCPETLIDCKYCKNIYRRLHIDQHEPNCPQRATIRCTSCFIIYYDGDGHADRCPERFVTCTNNHCERRVKAKNLHQHITRCPSTRLRCNNYPCQVVRFRSQIQCHEEEECPYR